MLDGHKLSHGFEILIENLRAWIEADFGESIVLHRPAIVELVRGVDVLMGGKSAEVD